MSVFEDCDKLRHDRNYTAPLNHETEEIRIPITLVGSSLAIVLECPECSSKHNLCKKEKKCKKEKRYKSSN